MTISADPFPFDKGRWCHTSANYGVRMAIALSNLLKKYIGPDGSVVPVIDIPELHVDDGAAETVGFIGSSGSGKKPRYCI